ncbi:MAG: response regulator, partial [Gemmatimonadota bacterium]
MPDESNVEDLFEDPALPGDLRVEGESAKRKGARARGPYNFQCPRCGKASTSPEIVHFCPHCGAPAAAAGTATGIRALLVDDALVARRKIGAVLKSLGCAVTEASDGVSALALLDEVHPNFIVLDVYMRPMGGLELLEELRQREEYARTPIVMLTAEADSQVVTEALRRKADDYLRKDARLDQLKERLLKQI